jgi:hypothetical protein
MTRPALHFSVMTVGCINLLYSQKLTAERSCQLAGAKMLYINCLCFSPKSKRSPLFNAISRQPHGPSHSFMLFI